MDFLSNCTASQLQCHSLNNYFKISFDFIFGLKSSMDLRLFELLFESNLIAFSGQIPSNVTSLISQCMIFQSADWQMLIQDFYNKIPDQLYNAYVPRFSIFASVFMISLMKTPLLARIINVFTFYQLVNVSKHYNTWVTSTRVSLRTYIDNCSILLLRIVKQLFMYFQLADSSYANSHGQDSLSTVVNADFLS